MQKLYRVKNLKQPQVRIKTFLKTKSPIVIGYSGWEDDVIMVKLRERFGIRGTSL